MIPIRTTLPHSIVPAAANSKNISEPSSRHHQSRDQTAEKSRDGENDAAEDREFPRRNGEFAPDLPGVSVHGVLVHLVLHGVGEDPDRHQGVFPMAVLHPYAARLRLDGGITRDRPAENGRGVLVHTLLDFAVKLLAVDVALLGVEAGQIRHTEIGQRLRREGQDPLEHLLVLGRNRRWRI